MPPVTEQALRVAVLSLEPAAAVRFEQEFHGAWREAVQTDSTVPMHTFLRRWAVFVALRHVPARARRLRELEQAIADAETLVAARPAAAELAAMLDEAAREAAA